MELLIGLFNVVKENVILRSYQLNGFHPISVTIKGARAQGASSSTSSKLKGSWRHKAIVIALPLLGEVGRNWSGLSLR